MKYKLLTLLILTCLLFTACHSDSAGNSVANSISDSESTISSNPDSTYDAINSSSSQSTYNEIVLWDNDTVSDKSNNVDFCIVNSLMSRTKIFQGYNYSDNQHDRFFLSWLNDDNHNYLIHSEYSYDKHNDYLHIYRNSKKNKHIIYGKDYYADNSTGYNEIENNVVAITSFENCKIHEVTYKNFSEGKIPMNEKWESRFYEEINSLDSSINISVTPPIIEMWSFNHNHNKYDIITVSNVFNNSIITDGTDLYKITLIFINDEISDLSDICRKCNIYMRIPKSCDIPLLDVYLEEFKSVQSYIILDIDNDSNPEILFYHEYGHFQEEPIIIAYKIDNPQSEYYVSIYAGNFININDNNQKY